MDLNTPLPKRQKNTLTPKDRLERIFEDDNNFRQRINITHQSSSPTKINQNDIRTPRQKNELLLWAQEYRAADYHTPQELIDIVLKR